MLDYGNVIRDNASWIGTEQHRWFNHGAVSASDSKTYSQKYNVNLAVNLFPLAAYQKIYQDFFRWSQWENADPTSYNFDWHAGSGSIFGTSLNISIPATNDYWKRDNLFSLRYANWNKDKFMGVLPNSQFGDLAVVDLGTMSISGSKVPVGAYDGTNDTGSFHQFQTYSASANNSSGADTATSIYPRDPDNIIVRPGSNLWAVLGTSPDLNLKFSVLALRQAEALQKWKEITQSVDTNYRDQIKAHFGVNVPQSESHMANYIGGIARNLDISEVVNQQLSSETDQALISAIEEVEVELKNALAQDDFQPRKRIVELTEYAKTLDTQMDTLDNDIATYQGDIKYSERIQQNIELVHTEIQTLEKRLEALSSLRMALSKNGIPFFSLIESIHIFELEVNKALYQLGTNIRIGIEAYKTLASYDDICHACGYKFSDSKNTCVICGAKRQYKRQETLAIQMQGVSFNVDFLEDSGGGMLLVSLAIRLALFSIFRDRGKMQDIDFWFLDEVFSPLDISARNNMLQFLDDLRDSYGLSQLFLISHTDMSDILQPAITVERNEEAEESYLIA